jgi:hypothetical protein
MEPKTKSEENPEVRSSGSTDGLDWSQPSRMRQMNSGWILLWLVIPFLATVIYGLWAG